MSRLLVLFLALLLPVQFAWSAASAYCQHETTAESRHVGHHAHVHEGEARKVPGSQLAVDTDCASCHAAGTAVIAATPDSLAFPALAAPAPPVSPPPFTSALARAPDRPQWLRLV